MLYEFHYGFREKHSVIHALLDANSKLPCYLWTFVKHSTLSHILLQILYHYGIRGIAYKLLESYLSFRNQFVSMQNHHFSLKAINIGVPQGSTLGPLLFLIYVNDISNSVSCNPCLFADDTCLLVSTSTPVLVIANLHYILQPQIPQNSNG